MAGWSYEDWKGRVYPRGLAAGDRLRYLAGCFDCIEINSTFYALPRPGAAARWAAQVEGLPGFMFTAKLLRTLTHEHDPDWSQAEAYRQALAPLAASGRLGAVLAQFPWHFARTEDHVARIARIADHLEDWPLVLELRHASFLHEAFLDFLARRGLGLAEIDLPATAAGMRPHGFVGGMTAYFRFHGRNRAAWFDPAAGRDAKFDYLYSPEELAPWTGRIRAAAAGAAGVYVIANNHYRGQAPATAIDLARLLGGAPPVPPPLAAAFPHLAGGWP